MTALTAKQRWSAFWLQWKFIKRINAGRHRKALWLLWRNELSKAGALLSRSSDPQMRFARACVELEAGDLEAAAWWSSTLPRDPAQAVLAALVALRAPESPYRSRANASWLGALVTAWQDAGRPDLRTSPCFGDDFQQSYDRGDGRHLAYDERMLWRWMSSRYGFFRRKGPAAVRRWAATRASHQELPDLLISAAVLNLMETLAERAAVLDRIAERMPENFSVQLARFTSHPGWVARGELAQLEAVLEAPHIDAMLNGDAYTRLEGIASRAGSRSPEVVAYRATLAAIILPSISVLTAELQDVRGPNRRAAAELVVRVGRRLRDDRYLASHLYGWGLMRNAARVLGDQKLFNELAAQHEGVKKLMEVHSHLHLDPARWPLPSMFREVLRRLRTNESDYYRDFLRLAVTSPAPR